MKSGFRTSLDVRLKDGSDGIWIVASPLKYWSELLNCLIVVPPWFETKEPDSADKEDSFFETDFASVPRVPFAYSLWGDRAHREATLHDFVYREDGTISIYSEEAKGELGYRAEGAVVILVRTLAYSEGNDLFLEAMKSTGKPWYISYPMYVGVVAVGWTAYHKKRVRDKL